MAPESKAEKVKFVDSEGAIMPNNKQLVQQESNLLKSQSNLLTNFKVILFNQYGSKCTLQLPLSPRINAAIICPLF